MKPGQYVSGGYYLILPAPRPAGCAAELVPQQVLTVTDCIVDRAPDTWAISWASASDDERGQEAAKFHLRDDELQGFVEWSTQALDEGLLGWPSTFFELETALTIHDRLASDELVILGISLETDNCDDLLQDFPTAENMGTPGVIQALERHAPIAPGGSRVGFDVLGWDGWGFHSYLCNGLQDEFQSALGVTPNEFGFFSEEEARMCAEYAGLETTGAEPGMWLPWAITIYELKLEA